MNNDLQDIYIKIVNYIKETDLSIEKFKIKTDSFSLNFNYKEELMLSVSINADNTKYNLGTKFNSKEDSAMYLSLSKDGLIQILFNFLDFCSDIHKKKEHHSYFLDIFDSACNDFLDKGFFLLSLEKSDNTIFFKNSKNENLIVKFTNDLQIELYLQSNSMIDDESLLQTNYSVPLSEYLKSKKSNLLKDFFDIAYNKLRINKLLKEIELLSGKFN